MRAILLGLTLLLLPALAGADEGVPAPTIIRGKGEACVAASDYMRRFHMQELVHKRDATMHDGIRTPKFSLKECVSCHAATGSDGRPVPVNAKGQFCESCHEYAAVSIDCFECHATVPADERQAAAPFPTTADAPGAVQ